MEPVLLHAENSSTFQLRDRSVLAIVDAFVLNSMRGDLQEHLQGAGMASKELLSAAMALPNNRLLGILQLTYYHFTKQQSSVLSQDCGIVINTWTRALMLNNNISTQSGILGVLLIMSKVCLLGA